MNSLIVTKCYDNAKKKSDKPDEKNFTTECKFCPNRVISGNITNSSNFLKHVQEQHPREFKHLEVMKSQVGSRKRKNDQLLDTTDSEAKPPKRQALLDLKSAQCKVRQDDFDSALCSMIVIDM